MAERLTVSLEDGVTEKLRELAGGERKVGAYLSQLVAWLLWPHKEELDAAGPLGCVILRKDKLENMPGAEVEAMWRATQHLQAEAGQVRAEADRLAAESAETKALLKAIETESVGLLQEMRSNYERLLQRTAELEKRLPTQEDSGHNDA